MFQSAPYDTAWFSSGGWGILLVRFKVKEIFSSFWFYLFFFFDHNRHNALNVKIFLAPIHDDT